MNRRYDYDYSKLKGKLREKGIIYKILGEKIGISETSVSERINNNAQFTQEEMEKTMSVLEEPLNKVDEYFFTHLV